MNLEHLPSRGLEGQTQNRPGSFSLASCSPPPPVDSPVLSLGDGEGA